MLMINVLNHFGYKENVFLSVQNGTHCEYVYKKNEKGEGVFANLIIPFIEGVREKQFNH